MRALGSARELAFPARRLVCAAGLVLALVFPTDALASPFADRDDDTGMTLFAIPPLFFSIRAPEQRALFVFPFFRETTPRRDELMLFPFFSVSERRKEGRAARVVSFFLGALELRTLHDADDRLIAQRRLFLIFSEDWRRDEGRSLRLLGIPLLWWNLAPER